MRVFVRRDQWAVLFAAGAVIVLVLAYIPIVRAHQGWEDEVYWVSTCLSMLRHRGDVPSVLSDYPSPANPLRFYGPTLFWLGAAVLKVFGFSMRTWRSFTFAGNIAYVTAVGVLFYRLRRSWAIAMGAVLFSSLSLGLSFGISLPGRPDAWTLTLIVLALALVANGTTEDEPTGAPAPRWIAFGALLGVAATTTPRVWPLLALMVLLLPMIVAHRRVQSMAMVAASSLVVWSLILLPLRITPWGFFVSVRHASTGDAMDVSPLMGGSWGFGHSLTQIFYYGALIIVLGLIDISRWRKITHFERWLVAIALANLAITLALTARALNMFTYWGFLLEIAALCAWTQSVPGMRIRVARGIGMVLCIFMVSLRVARELPTLMHWEQQNPAVVERELRANIGPGSVVYGLPGRYFYPVHSIGGDYRQPVDGAFVGRASTPGRPGLPAPMRDACRAPAYLVWPGGDESEPLPPLPYATPERVASYSNPPEQRSALERIVEKVPGGRSGEEQREFAIYRLVPHPQYCLEAGASAAH
ncbi:MAG TPA: hypothetical protein VGM02_14260 [Acidobacteriaceae bacterium]|jgi:hypothetical protein